MNLRSSVFLVLAVVHLAVPGVMIYRHEQTLRTGHVFKLRTAPVDPYDAFRGRYVTLSFKETDVKNKVSFASGERAWALLEVGPDGFAKISKLTRELPPGDDSIPVKAEWNDGESTHVQMPFDRYYMTEESAPQAEAAYWANSRRNNENSYATIRVRQGNVVLEELYIGDKPIREYLKTQPAAK